MGLFFKLNEPSAYEREMAKKKNRKTIFNSYRSAEDFAEDCREEYESWEDAMDAWEDYRRRKKKK